MPNSNETIIDSIGSLGFVKPVVEFISDRFNSFGEIVWLIFFAVLIFFVIYSLILVYHWLRYGVGSFAIWVAMIVYFVISFALLSALYLSALNI
jgi:hypothetical protein